MNKNDDKKRTLADEFPDIAKLWAADLNPLEKSPETLGPGSAYKAAFRCPQGHVFERTVNNMVRSYKRGNELCPDCKSNIKDKSLAVLFPQISSLWDHELNPKDVSPEDFIPGSSFIAKFRCPQDHCFERKIRDMVRSYKKGNELCPYCPGYGNINAPKKGRSLAELFPEISEMWADDLNPKDKTPELLGPGSTYKAAFRCHNGHVFERKIQHIVKSYKNGYELCPECKKYIAVSYPGVSALWAYDLNSSDISPENQGADSAYEAKWRCPKGHVFEEQICEMVKRYKRQNELCPCCRNEVKGKKLAVVCPEVSALWAYDLNPSDKTPETLSIGSTLEAKWRCSKGHVFERIVRNMVKSYNNGHEMCPYCKGDRVVAPNGSRKLGEYYPEISAMWAYDLNPPDKTPKTLSVNSNYKAKFRCPKGHVFQRIICNVVKSQKKGQELCTYCRKKESVQKKDKNLKTESPEISAMWAYDLNPSDKTPESLSSKSEYEAWFRCPEGHVFSGIIQNIVWSYKKGHGKCPFCDRDSKRNSLATSYPEISEMWAYDLNPKDISPENLDIRSFYKVKFRCINGHVFERPVYSIVSSYKAGHVLCPYCNDFLKYEPKENKSLAALYPEVSKLWAYDLNPSDKTPETVDSGSSYKATFRCQKGHVFTRTVYGAVNSYKTGQEICLTCIKLRGKTDFGTAYPEAAGMWDYEKNPPDKTPYDFPTGSAFVAYFTCPNGHSFKKSINRMVEASDKGLYPCRYCRGRCVIPGETDVATEHPEILKVWDFEKNTIDPRQISSSYNNKAYFICERGHSTHRYVASWISSPECPECKIENFFNDYPELENEWDKLDNYLLLDSKLNMTKEYIWKCPKGHKYEMTLASRISFYERRRTACPQCKGAVSKKTIMIKPKNIS